MLLSPEEPPTAPMPSVQISASFQGLVSEAWLRALAIRVLALSEDDIPGRANKSTFEVVITDDETVRGLNRHHRGVDETTDVLAFAFRHQGEYYGPGESSFQWSADADFIVPPGSISVIGEIIISYPQAVNQAEGSGHTIRQELTVLVIHGALHLLGYDHMEPHDEAEMKAEEARLLAEVMNDE